MLAETKLRNIAIMEPETICGCRQQLVGRERKLSDCSNSGELVHYPYNSLKINRINMVPCLSARHGMILIKVGHHSAVSGEDMPEK